MTENNVGIIFFMSFHGHYNAQKCVSNIHYMANKIITSGYKGKWIKRIGIVISFKPIRIFKGVIFLVLCFNGHYDYVNVTLMPNISWTKCLLKVSKEKHIKLIGID